MEDALTYACENCGKQQKGTGTETSPPECCNRKMKKLPLPVCELSTTAEHFRLSESMDPCDDGRAGGA